MCCASILPKIHFRAWHFKILRCSNCHHNFHIFRENGSANHPLTEVRWGEVRWSKTRPEMQVTVMLTWYQIFKGKTSNLEHHNLSNISFAAQYRRCILLKKIRRNWFLSYKMKFGKVYMDHFHHFHH